MAMTWSSLIGPKTQAGSIALWTNYSLLDSETILDEAQTLLYSEARLRCREMMTDYVFTMPQYGAMVALPSGFLDPIGPINAASYNSQIRHKDSQYIQANRTYNETTGSLGTNPFTTTIGSVYVNVYLANHGFTQDSIFNVTGGTFTNGVTVNGTFPITAIVDANDFTIDITILGATPTAAGADGGSGCTYLCDALVAGNPYFWGIWTTSTTEFIRFDQAFSQTTVCRLQYFQSLPLLSSTNQTNFLTNRYPKLMRIACMAAAAEFMKDDGEYQKWISRLQSATAMVEAENEMQYRGLELDPIIP